MEPGAARRGGMPLYKFVGNKILTTFENAVVGMDLSEWHTGYRAYSLDALRDIPFERQLQRVRLRHPDHRAAPRGREADRGGPDPDLLRRRDLVRERHAVRRARSSATCSATACTRWASGSGETAFASERVRAQGERRHLAQPAARLARCTAAESGPRPRLLRRRASRARSACTATTSPGVDIEEHPGVRERDRHASSPATSIGASPTRSGTGYDVVLAADVLEHVRRPSSCSPTRATA